MKMNKRGFILSEVVIVAAVISTILVFLYISLNRMSQAYETRNRYYDIDAIYATIEINNILNEGNYIETYTEQNLHYINLINNDGNDDVKAYKNFYSNTNYTINEVYYAESNIESLKGLSNELNDNKFDLKDYIDYLKDNINYNNYDYLIIIELKKGDDLYYYTLKVGDSNET